MRDPSDYELIWCNRRGGTPKAYLNWQLVFGDFAALRQEGNCDTMAICERCIASCVLALALAGCKTTSRINSLLEMVWRCRVTILLPGETHS